jgi:hypothetical protein
MARNDALNYHAVLEKPKNGHRSNDLGSAAPAPWDGRAAHRLSLVDRPDHILVHRIPAGIEFAKSHKQVALSMSYVGTMSGGSK